MTDKTNTIADDMDDMSTLEYVLANVRGASPVSMYRQSDFVPAETADDFDS